MNVISLMALPTLALELFDGVHRLPMTTAALQPFVCACQREVRLGIVVKSPAGPACGVMAALTLITEIAFMYIVVLMTAAAGCSVADKAIVLMTILTSRGGMGT